MCFCAIIISEKLKKSTAKNMSRLLFLILLILNFVLPLSVMTRHFDVDFGWHLRFGKETVEKGFQFLDTYTFTKYGEPWTNHEWGGDIFFWNFYKTMGYWLLNLVFTAAIFASFLIIIKTFNKKITTSGLIFSAFCSYACLHIYIMRLAMLAPLFMAIWIWTHEKIKFNPKYALLFIPTIYIWSILHGSWILGFIITCVYVSADIFIRIMPIKFQKFFSHENINKKTYKYMSLAIFVGACAILLNPYGIKIYAEVLDYFQQGFYKYKISEWLPAYTFPVYWKILIIQTFAGIFAIIGLKNKKMTFENFLLFCALFYSSWAHKRNGLFAAVVSVPILSQTYEYVVEKINQKINQVIYSSVLAIAILATFFFTSRIHYTDKPWNDQMLYETNNLPFGAIKFLESYTQNNAGKIFNEFAWGGLLNWHLPNLLVFFDGRGTATWMYDKNKTMLEKYYEIYHETGDLAELERQNVNYILLKKHNFMPFAKPNALDKFIFTKFDFYTDKSPLEVKLDKNPNWQKIYSDNFSNIWEFQPPRTIARP
jgi:hypothetical protein